MRKTSLYSRTFIYTAVLICLLFPLALLASYGIYKKMYELEIIALFCASFSSVSVWFLLRLWERKMKSVVELLVQTKMDKIQEIPSEMLFQQKQEIYQLKNQVQKLNLEMEKKLEEMRIAYLEFDDLRKEHQKLEEETAHQQEEFQKKLKQKDSILNEYHKTIVEQRGILEKKQKYIFKLEAKLNDLMEEFKHLLQIDPATSPVPKELELNKEILLNSFFSPQSSLSHYDRSLQLQRFIEKIEGVTGVDHLGYKSGSSPRFLGLSLEHYTVDKRFLFDLFQNERKKIIFIFSFFEQKLLFVSEATHPLLGMHPEKFIKHFSEYMMHEHGQWEKAMHQLKSSKETSTKLTFRHKNGQLRSFECHVGKIFKGPFINNALGYLMP